jgi:hypothetical protein
MIVAFILSTNFAGSHFLSLMLGSHSRAMHLGETRRLRKRPRTKQPCYLCGDGEDCHVFRGIDADSIGDLYPRVLAQAPPGIEVLVDNSKKPSWAARFLDDGRYEKRFIHLVRDPRALMRRWAMDYAEPRKRIEQRITWTRRRPDLALPLLLSSHARFFLYKWLAKNQEISRFIDRHGLESRVITYHDLAKSPHDSLREIVEWLGLEYEAEQVEYWRFEHHGSQKAEYEWVKRERTQFIDLRWQSFLSEADQQWAIGHARVTRYLAEIGLEFAPEGLTRSKA